MVFLWLLRSKRENPLSGCSTKTLLGGCSQETLLGGSQLHCNRSAESEGLALGQERSLDFNFMIDSTADAKKRRGGREMLFAGNGSEEASHSLPPIPPP